MLLDEPAGVVAPPEGVQGEAQFLDGVEGLDPKQLLLNRNSKRQKKANQNGDSGVSAGVRQATNNVGSGKKKRRNR